MKLAMVSHYFESHRGGIEIVAGGLARAIAPLGYEIIWLASNTSPAPDHRATTVIPLPATNILEDRCGIPMPIPTFSGIVRLFRAIRGADAVLVHDALYPTSVLAFIAARIWRKPFIVVAHLGAVPYESWVLRQANRIANNIIACPVLARADRVVVISEITARYFASVRFRAPPTFIFNGLDTDIFRPVADSMTRSEIRDRLGFPPDHKVALFVGRFVEKKGLHVVHQMAQRRPDIFWALAGWGTIDPRNWGLPNVKVYSDLKDASLAPLYQACDVFVLPSVGEGYPLVVQEAIACGLPVVCGAETARADQAAMKFLTPVTMNVGDELAIVEKFCAAVEGVLGAPLADRSSSVSDRFRFACERYSWTKCAQDYAALIKSTLSDRRGTSLTQASAGPATRENARL